jgi:hypothetical protein
MSMEIWRIGVVRGRVSAAIAVAIAIATAIVCVSVEVRRWFGVFRVGKSAVVDDTHLSQAG